MAIPFLFFLILKNKGTKALSILARFFLYKNNSFSQRDAWIHAVSLGELTSTQPILDIFKKHNIKTNISVSTTSGFNKALEMNDSVRFLPFEIFLPFWIKPSKILIVMETELWYFLYLFAKKKSATTILINARMPDNNFKKYHRFRFLYKKIFEQIDYIFTQSKEDEKNLIALGAKNITTIGNIKSNILPKVTKKYKKPKQLTIVGASTHTSEEELIFDSFCKLKLKEKKLIIAPRKDYTFDKVDILLKKLSSKNNFSYSRFSQDQSFESDVVLIDKLGILNDIYAISDIAILGGSFIDNEGGHNPIEPAFFGCKLITGKNIFEQKESFAMVKNYLICQDKKDLTKSLQDATNEKFLKANIIKQVNLKPLEKIINESI